MPESRAVPLALALDDEDQELRLARFRDEHPYIVILLLGTWPKAWIGDEKFERPTLRELLDVLDEALSSGERKVRP
jgi:hypothetical protein